MGCVYMWGWCGVLCEVVFFHTRYSTTTDITHTPPKKQQFVDEVSARTAFQAYNGFKLSPTDVLKLTYAKR